MTTDVFLSALEMALGRLGVKDNLLLHSDRGSQYCSAAFHAALAHHELRCSMQSERQLLGQRGVREFLCEPEKGAGVSAGLCDS